MHSLNLLTGAFRQVAEMSVFFPEFLAANCFVDSNSSIIDDDDAGHISVQQICVPDSLRRIPFVTYICKV